MRKRTYFESVNYRPAKMSLVDNECCAGCTAFYYHKIREGIYKPYCRRMDLFLNFSDERINEVMSTKVFNAEDTATKREVFMAIEQDVCSGEGSRCEYANTGFKKCGPGGKRIQDIGV